MRWYDRYDESGGFASVMTFDDYVSPEPKPGVLMHLAEQVLGDAADSPSRVSMALLARERPRFIDGAGPPRGLFTDDLKSTLEWVGQLDESYVAVQGPPGSGKTYSGSHIIHALIKSGKRVGIAAMSHAAIDNLFAATHQVFADKGELSELHALRKVTSPRAVLSKESVTPSRPRRRKVRSTTWSRVRRGCGPDNNFTRFRSTYS